MSFRAALFLAMAVQFCLTTSGQAQSSQQSPTTAPSGSNPQPVVPVTMTECEGVNDCASWTFLGAQGNGQWPSGELANLNVERYDKDSVVIRRADSTGASAGLTAIYTGTRHGDRVGGEFTSSWPGHWTSKSGNWYATLSGPITLPTEIHECDVNCITLKLENGNYVYTTHYSWEPPNLKVTWTVESFTRESVALHRTWPVDQVFKGQMSKDGNSLVNVTVNGSPDPKVQIAWGNALNTVYGSNQERDNARGVGQSRYPVVVVAPVVCVPWFFTVVCAQ